MGVLSGTCISKRLSCEKVGWVFNEKLFDWFLSKTARVKSCNEIVICDGCNGYDEYCRCDGCSS